MEYKQKKVIVNEVEYTLQKLPVRETMQLRQQWQDENGNVDDVKMCDLLFEHIVVSPKVKLDDFDDVADVESLGKECMDFLFRK